MTYTYTTQAQIRDAFWEMHPDLKCNKGPRGRILPQNSQPCDTRCAFVDFVDSLSRDGQIGPALSQKVTL